MSRARELSRLGNPNIISADGSFNVGFGTLTPKEKVNVVGVVSATSFFGDGSGLDGIASAGIGTALSDDKTKALNTIYYTNNEVLVNTTSTIDPPESGYIAYTQAPTIVVEDTKELIVAPGDDLLVDVLGISTGVNVDYAQRGNGVFGNIYVDNIESSGGQTSVNFPRGLVSSGITTITNGTQSTSATTGALQVTGGVGIAKSVYIGGNLSVGGTITYEDVTNVDSVGLITARSVIDVTGGNIEANNILDVPTIRRQVQNSSILIAGGNATNDGANIALYGSTHSSQANNFEFRTSGVERLRIGSAGQIGLGGANYGTSGQILTSQGASAAPQWADAGGVWTKLASGTTTNAGFGGFPVTTNGFTSTYFYYKILFMLTTADNQGTRLGIDFTTDNGSTWASESGSNMYRFSNSGRQSNSNMGLDGTESQGWFLGSNTKEKWYGEISIVEPYLATTTKSVLALYSASQIDDTHDGAMMCNVTLKPVSNFLLPVTGIRFVTNGSIATLKWSLLASAL